MTRVSSTMCNYELIGLVSQGGMGEVYSSIHIPTKRPVALKVMRPEIAAAPEFRDRFQREALMLSSLDHANIVRLYEYDYCGDSPFLAMEFMNGETLKSFLDKTPQPTVPFICRIGCEVLAALGCAHRAGIIHRDLSPSNVFLCANGVIKLIDFGIARSGVTEKTLTQAGAVLGKPEYMSPEQAQGTLNTDNIHMSLKSDLYSLGIMLFQMVTGRLPYTGDNTMQVLYQQVHKPLPPLPSTLPRQMKSVITRALQKRPEARFRNSDEMRTALEHVWKQVLQPRTPTFAGVVVRSAGTAVNSTASESARTGMLHEQRKGE